MADPNTAPTLGDTGISENDIPTYKTAIITGCASGIGLATTILFLQQSYRVLGVDNQELNYERLKSVTFVDKEGRRVNLPLNARFCFYRVDLTRPQACDSVVETVIDVWGPKVSVLANIAGVMDNFGSADTLDDADWDRIIAINLTVPIKMMRAVLPLMKEANYGNIINMSSKAGTSGAVSGVAYTASKHGLIGATRNVAWRFNCEGIRCNAICPGGVATNIEKSVTEGSYDEEALRTIKPVITVHVQDPSGEAMRLVEAVDVAKAVLFLASDDARMINGVCLPVDRAFGVI